MSLRFALSLPMPPTLRTGTPANDPPARKAGAPAAGSALGGRPSPPATPPDLWEFIFRNCPTPCLISDERSGEILLANDEFFRFVQRPAGEVLGRRSVDLGIWASLQAREEVVARLRSQGRLRNLEVQHIVSGQPRTVLLSMERLDLDGRTCILSNYIDITERKEIENAFRQTITVFEQAGEAIVIMDPHGRIMSVNPAFTRLTGFSGDDAAFRHLDALLHKPTGRYPAGLFSRLVDQLSPSGRWKGELWAMRKDGTEFGQWLSLSAVRNENGELENFVALFSDNSEQRRRAEQLQHMALHDPLTGLPNRSYLSRHLESAVREARKNASLLALLFCDLDNFKDVNDLHGHEMGDRLLKAVTQRLQQGLRSTDIIARMGGDEFVVVVPELRNEDSAESIARHVIAQLAQPIVIDGFEFSIGVSIGASVWPSHGPSGDDLLRHADQALYQAKARGRGTFVMWKSPV